MKWPDLDTSFLDHLAFEAGPQKPRTVQGAIASWVRPQVFDQAQVLAWSDSLKDQFDITPPRIPQLLSLFRGQSTLHPLGNWATCYGGHQFGNWADQLGDGRAMTLGFIKDRDGSPWEWQMKGFGLTPYSRGGDGLAVLRSSLREFVASEAMHHLGVPTTRALALLSTESSVMRDILYSGNPRLEPGALCLRVAPSFIRIGHFEILAARKEQELLINLFKWVTRDQPEVSVIDFFKVLTQKTLDLILQWMQLGFVHGVMNTDNMSIHGLTLDYGPYGWLSSFDPNFTPNTTDFRQYRYAWGKQYEIGIWNLSRLAGALLSLHPSEEDFISILKSYHSQMESALLKTFSAKIGLHDGNPQELQMTQELLVWLQTNAVDFTLFFKWLETSPDPLNNLEATLLNISYSTQLNFNELRAWLKRYQATQLNKPGNPLAKPSPLFIARNHLLFQAIQECETLLQNEEFKKELKTHHNPAALFPRLHEIMTHIQKPFELPKNFCFSKPLPDLYARAPDWALKTPGCNQLSCSS